jgi:hypothetical protein
MCGTHSSRTEDRLLTQQSLLFVVISQHHLLENILAPLFRANTALEITADGTGHGVLQIWWLQMKVREKVEGKLGSWFSTGMAAPWPYLEQQLVLDIGTYGKHQLSKYCRSPWTLRIDLVDHSSGYIHKYFHMIFFTSRIADI